MTLSLYLPGRAPRRVANRIVRSARGNRDSFKRENIPTLGDIDQIITCHPQLTPDTSVLNSYIGQQPALPPQERSPQSLVQRHAGQIQCSGVAFYLYCSLVMQPSIANSRRGASCEVMCTAVHAYMIFNRFSLPL